MASADWLRSTEFHLPPLVARFLHWIGPDRFNPYRPEDDVLQAIFVHVPKTGGTSVRAGLYGVRSNHVPLSRFRAFDPDRYARYFKFAFVRNPWDRMVSAYTNLSRMVGTTRGRDGRWASEHLRGFSSFEQFIHSLDDRRRRREVLRWVHFRPQVDWLRIPGEPGVGCDFVGRFETIARDYAHVCQRLGVDRPLPLMRTSERKPYPLAYSPMLIDRVGELYADDVATFGYRFE